MVPEDIEKGVNRYLSSVDSQTSLSEARNLIPRKLFAFGPYLRRGREQGQAYSKESGPVPGWRLVRPS